jgi:hypothetical protein
MNRFFTLLAALLIGTLPLAAKADPILVNTLYGFGFGGVGSALESSAGFIQPTNPAGTVSPDPAWTFTLASPGTLTFLDLFLSVDQFEIFDNLVSLGVTSAPVDGGTCGSDFTCALADARYSRGIFALAPGSYSITGTHLAGQSGAGAFIVETTVPEPGTLALLGLALAGFAASRRRKQ